MPIPHSPALSHVEQSKNYCAILWLNNANTNSADNHKSKIYSTKCQDYPPKNQTGITKTNEVMHSHLPQHGGINIIGTVTPTTMILWLMWLIYYYVGWLVFNGYILLCSAAFTQQLL